VVYANQLRLERAKADDFRQHPDRKYRVEVGSDQDSILIERPSGRITLKQLKRWQWAYDWAENKKTANGMHDESSIPDVWAFIPKTYQKQVYNKHNKNSPAGHYLTAVWLAYHNSCPLALSTTSRIPTPISEIKRPSGILQMSFHQVIADEEEKKYTCKLS
jgi:hypothetical protein